MNRFVLIVFVLLSTSICVKGQNISYLVHYTIGVSYGLEYYNKQSEDLLSSISEQKNLMGSALGLTYENSSKPINESGWYPYRIKLGVSNRSTAILDTLGFFFYRDGVMHRRQNIVRSTSSQLAHMDWSPRLLLNLNQRSEQESYFLVEADMGINWRFSTHYGVENENGSHRNSRISNSSSGTIGLALGFSPGYKWRRDFKNSRFFDIELLIPLEYSKYYWLNSNEAKNGYSYGVALSIGIGL